MGSARALAAHLHVTETEIRAWLEARVQPPEEHFLGALEVVLLDLEAGHSPRT